MSLTGQGRRNGVGHGRQCAESSERHACRAKACAGRPRRPPHIATALIATLLGLLTLAGTVVIVRQPDSALSRPGRAPSEQPPPTDADVPFPSATASDVVSYSDHVALATAVTDADAPPTSSARRIKGERIVMRHVTFWVDDVLWSRPGATRAPSAFTTKWWGWIVRDGKRTPFIVSGAPTVFLGAQYVVPIAHDGRAFTVLQPFAVFRFHRNAVAPEEQATPLARHLEHRSAAGISEVFQNAAPDPLAARYAHLPPRPRLSAVRGQRTHPSGAP